MHTLTRPPPPSRASSQVSYPLRSGVTEFPTDFCQQSQHQAAFVAQYGLYEILLGYFTITLYIQQVPPYPEPSFPEKVKSRFWLLCSTKIVFCILLAKDSCFHQFFPEKDILNGLLSITEVCIYQFLFIFAIFRWSTVRDIKSYCV